VGSGGELSYRYQIRSSSLSPSPDVFLIERARDVLIRARATQRPVRYVRRDPRHRLLDSTRGPPTLFVS
jgi:hypothetical protein